MITVITGPPCSGKTTYVHEHAQPGDIIIDFDTIAQALGSPDQHQHAWPIRKLTIAARRAAIYAAMSLNPDDAVWIIDGNIPPDRLRDYRLHDAQIIMLDADKDELQQRATRERPELWHALITQWEPPPRLDPDQRITTTGRPSP